MTALIEAGPLRARDRIDLLRGALDAWLHPPTPSRVPVIAALAGGGLWTVASAAVVFQPTPPDWPGYIAEIVGLALVAAGCLLVATMACSLRTGDGAGRPMAVAVGLTIIGYLAWIGALAATAAGVLDAPSLAAAQTLAMLGTTLVGAVLVRAGDGPIGLLVMLGPIAMLIPWTVLWFAFGAAWTAVGIVLVMERSRWPGAGPGANVI
jgi:hypothetical protein